MAKAPRGRKVVKVMREWKAGSLRSGSARGPKVTSQKQALAIAFSEQRKADRRRKTIAGTVVR